MQLETSYLEYGGAKMMVGYALIKNQRMIMILTEGQHDGQLRYMRKDENSGISRLSLDTFKTALPESDKDMKKLEQTNICLTGATYPNKLFFIRIDHSKDMEQSIHQKSTEESHNLSTINEE